MRSRIAGALAGLTLSLAASAAMAQQTGTETECVSAKTDWSVCIWNEPKECWGVSKPKETVNMRDGKPVQARRGDILLFVTFRPATGAAGEVSFTGGYPFAPGSTVGVDIQGKNARHRPREKVRRLHRQPVECRQVAERQVGRLPDGGADREACGLDRNRAPAGHRIHEHLRPRVPPRQHDQLRGHRLAQRGGSSGNPCASPMPRAEPDVDADDGAAPLRRASPARHEHDVRRIRVDFSGHPARGERFNDRVLDHSAQLERRSLEVVCRSEVH